MTLHGLITRGGCRTDKAEVHIGVQLTKVTEKLTKVTDGVGES
jgi:hypothetical protein